MKFIKVIVATALLLASSMVFSGGFETQSYDSLPDVFKVSEESKDFRFRSAESIKEFLEQSVPFSDANTGSYAMFDPATNQYVWGSFLHLQVIYPTVPVFGTRVHAWLNVGNHPYGVFATWAAGSASAFSPFNTIGMSLYQTTNTHGQVNPGFGVRNMGYVDLYAFCPGRVVSGVLTFPPLLPKTYIFIPQHVRNSVTCGIDN